MTKIDSTFIINWIDDTLKDVYDCTQAGCFLEEKLEELKTELEIQEELNKSKTIQIKAEVKLDSDAYVKFANAYFELAEATEDMTWLRDTKKRMLEAVQELRVGN